MKQFSKTKSLWLHFYPGILITLFFIIVAPIMTANGLPPQLAMLTAIIVVVVPVMLLHLHRATKNEGLATISELIVYKNDISTGKIVLYALGMIVFAFLVYGATQPLNQVITDKLLFWLPDWYTIQDFSGYSKDIIVITLIANLILNGIIAPFIEEIYFRGYLMPRMQSWGKLVPFMSAILFSLYHFWQPQVYLTLIIALMPMTYFTWKLKSLKLAIITHCGLNIIGALLSFAMINQ